MEYERFLCIKCGACCRNLGLLELYKDLDRGDGVCIYFNEETNLCSIYEIRPLICRVEEGYRLVSQQISYEEYICLNYKACKDLQNILKK